MLVDKRTYFGKLILDLGTQIENARPAVDRSVLSLLKEQKAEEFLQTIGRNREGPSR